MFIFYDTETSGLDKNFSQILQIAMVFTDSDFNVMASNKIECRCSPWVVPTPGALLTTGFVPDEMKFNPHSHYEMMREIDKWIRDKHWPLTFVGYNSVSFDEPVLAQNLYQNLFDPNLTSSGNQINGQVNGCADVMLMVQAVMTYMPGTLNLKTKTANGNPSLKLINIAKQNGVTLSDEEAHDAMNDIKATVGVAKLIKKVAPAIWQQLLGLSTPNGVQKFIDAHEIFAYTDTHYGKMRSAIVTALPQKANARAQALYNLDFDPTPYLNMTAAQLKALLLSGDKQKPLSLINKPSPVLMPIDMADAVMPAHYNEKLYTERAQKIKSHATFMENLQKAVEMATRSQLMPTPSVPEFSIDQQAPDALRPRLEQWMRDFKSAPNWKAAALILKDFYARFKEELAQDVTLSRYAKLAGRIIFENAPQELSMDKNLAMKKHIAARVLNPDINAPYTTVLKARRELEAIEKERADGKKWQEVTDSQIRTLKLYYTSIEKIYSPYLSRPPINDNPSVTDSNTTDANIKPIIPPAPPGAAAA